VCAAEWECVSQSFSEIHPLKPRNNISHLSLFFKIKNYLLHRIPKMNFNAVREYFQFSFFSSHTCTLLITKYVPTFLCLLFIWHTHCILYFQVMFGFLLLLLFFLLDRKPINHRILVSQKCNLLIVAFGMWYFILWCYAIKCIKLK